MFIEVDECAIGDEFYFRQKKYDSAYACYINSAKKKNVMALYMLGACYYYGNGVKADVVEAVKYWKEAFTHGDVRYSTYELACCYFFGEDGVKEDEAEAFRLWSIAADNGHKGAMNELGNSYFHGNGVPRDAKMAYIFWKKAHE
jgi:hypothetical protein